MRVVCLSPWHFGEIRTITGELGDGYVIPSPHGPLGVFLPKKFWIPYDLAEKK